MPLAGPDAIQHGGKGGRLQRLSDSEDANATGDKSLNSKLRITEMTAEHDYSTTRFDGGKQVLAEAEDTEAPVKELLGIHFRQVGEVGIIATDVAEDSSGRSPPLTAGHSVRHDMTEIIQDVSADGGKERVAECAREICDEVEDAER